MFGGIAIGLQMLGVSEAGDKHAIDGTTFIVVLTDGVPTRGKSELACLNYTKYE